MKILGAIVLMFLIPVAIVGLVAIIISIRPHEAAAPCIKSTVEEVTLLQTKYFDLRYPIAQRCLERFTQ